MHKVSTSSICLDSLFSNSCYRVIGDNFMKIKKYFEELNDNTDTVNIVDIEFQIVDSVSVECLEYCDLHDLNSIFIEYLREIRKNFSNLLNLSAELDSFRDEEIENTEHVVLRIEVRSSQKIAIEEYDRMVCWIAENVASDKSEHFTITVKRV